MWYYYRIMKSVSALVDRYRSNIKKLPSEVRERVNRPGGLDEQTLLDLILNPQDQGVDRPGQPRLDSVKIDYDLEVCARLGKDALKKGHVAYCIMAGGAGTRIGEAKALLRLPGIDMSLLTLKLFQAEGTGPIWIVVSPSLKERVADHVRSQAGIDQSRIEFIEQYESYRLTPDNQISFDSDGKPDMYPCGHGDLFPALNSSRLLDRFVSFGGRYVSIVNVDNTMGSLEPMIIGRHILSESKVSCEVVERSDEDAGGVLCDVNGMLQIVESFRIYGANPKEFKWLNTNSFIFNADIDIRPLGKNSWNRVQKNVGGRLVCQHERLLQEITAAYETNYLGVERRDRFMPIKSIDDLNAAGERLKADR